MAKQTLALMREGFTIHSFSPETPVPQAVYQAKVYFIAKTHDELSVVVPDDIPLESDESEGGWAAFEVLGPLGFSLTGILSQIAGVLAAENISIFAISTFDTDYILVKQEVVSYASRALRKANYKVTDDINQ